MADFGSLLKTATKAITEAGTSESPYLDALLLLCHVTGAPRERILSAFPGSLAERDQLTAAQEIQYRDLVRKKVLGAPIAYLLGEKEFYGRMFVVETNVLIPRPETELIIEIYTKLFTDSSVPKQADVLDLCCGSGCIGVTIAAEFPGTRVILSDISPDAVRISGLNAQRHLGQTVPTLLGDLYDTLPASSRFDCIVSNPPYVTDDEMLDHLLIARAEPKGALRGGVDGLDILRRVITGGFEKLRENGYLIVEIGCEQGEPVADLMSSQGFGDVQVHRDLAGLDRVVTGRR